MDITYTIMIGIGIVVGAILFRIDGTLTVVIVGTGGQSTAGTIGILGIGQCRIIGGTTTTLFVMIADGTM